jgi:hypothetical protein
MRYLFLSSKIPAQLLAMDSSMIFRRLRDRFLKGFWACDESKNRLLDSCMTSFRLFLYSSQSEITFEFRVFIPKNFIRFLFPVPCSNSLFPVPCSCGGLHCVTHCKHSVISRISLGELFYVSSINQLMVLESADHIITLVVKTNRYMIIRATLKASSHFDISECS